MSKFDSSLFYVGAKFHEWEILSLPYVDSRTNRTTVLAKCSCGFQKEHLPSTLKSGASKKCKACAASAKFTDHGMSHSPEHNTWRWMRQRCQNANSHKYPSYGGRGITICERWQGFENFYEDMGPKPEPDENGRYSIERMDNSKGYEPTNCIWASNKTQSRNRRTTKRYCFNGKSLTISEWSEETGINPSTLESRVRSGRPIEDLFKPAGKTREKSSIGFIPKVFLVATDLPATAIKKRITQGWSIANAVTLPANARNPDKICVHKVCGENYSGSALCKKYGISQTTFSRKIRGGMTAQAIVDDATTYRA